MRKFTVAVVLLIVLVGLPIGSWYYLQTGFNYRKEALEYLKPKGEITIEDQSLELKNYTTLIQLNEDHEELLKKVYDQYSSSNTFQLFSTIDPIENRSNWKELSESSLSSLKMEHESDFLLIDTEGQLRGEYIADKAGIKTMIEHISIVLPRVKEKDIKIKR